MKGILIGVFRNSLHMSYRKTMGFFHGQISHSLANGMVGPGGRAKGRAPDSGKGYSLRFCGPVLPGTYSGKCCGGGQAQAGGCLGSWGTLKPQEANTPNV